MKTLQTIKKQQKGNRIKRLIVQKRQRFKLTA